MLYKGPDIDYQHANGCECTCSLCAEARRILALPSISDAEISQAWKWLSNGSITPGPWATTQLKEFGAETFLFSASKNIVVASFKLVGSFGGQDFVAWCRDGVPKLLLEIERLKRELKQCQSG